ncbi:hypothetical protein QEG73_25490 [Chitinophagaceae bacterium 26-R-25]|nr:hypothetical protein [Chitinophagaceae bacterium 26-R-25]
MEGKDAGIGEAFIEAVRNKIEKQDKKIVEMEELLQVLPHIKDKLSGIFNLFEILNDSKARPDAIEIDVNKLLEALENTSALLQKRAKQSVHHHHHFSKPAWIITGLLLIVTIMVSDLYLTYRKLDGYMANDIKYRFLKLDTTTYPLQKRLYVVDSIYKARHDFRAEVIELEEERQYRLDELSKARSLRIEADEHEKKGRQNKPVR